MSWLTLALKKYAQFHGRSRRREFWMFALFCIIVYTVAMILDNALGITYELLGQDVSYGPIYSIVGLALLVPSLAVGVRRLHDIDKSGWYILVNLIPIIGNIWFIVMMITEGTKGDNQYGPDPKAEYNDISTL
ncbi:MAG: DUF805 domain-containing protein [Bacteroidales bacterium]|nr:DUF805 domain-containing protein [Bacteroidales bacterium]